MDNFQLKTLGFRKNKLPFHFKANANVLKLKSIDIVKILP